ncbi:MAG: beta-N-acetylhexosaminidase [Kutzneria sp.]|nr:beta-N-acetylhexosaminidase [Kutzneria sp.]MBV9846643.1 beta-N-acetylhexosaminidase [Kutzneria sp.]
MPRSDSPWPAAIREWLPGGAAYTFTEDTRIVVDRTAVDRIGTTASAFAEELRAVTGVDVEQRSDDADQVRAGDVFLTLGPREADLGEEGYRLRVGSSVVLDAPTRQGLFRATRTVLRLLGDGLHVPAGSARDWPAYPLRGLMVDVGRKYFTHQWLHDQVREMADLGLNCLHLHLSDDLGFRLESSTHPEIVSQAHYTKRDIAELLALADRYHVTIIPEIDMPGHLGAVLDSHPELRLRTDAGAVSPGSLDVTLPASHALVEDLIGEYLALFPGPYWHLGGDEYVRDYAEFPALTRHARTRYGPDATAKDAYYAFVNWASGLLRQAGRTVLVWNDEVAYTGSALTLADDVIVDYWSNRGPTPQHHADRGRTLLNSSFAATYYITSGNPPA